MVLLVLLVAVTGVLAWLRGWLDDWGLVQPRAILRVDGEWVQVPEPVAGGIRPLPPVPVTTVGSYAFLETESDGSPVGYDPCRPVTWVVNPEDAVPQWEALVSEAAAEIQVATGLKVEYAGTTDEEATTNRPVVQDRYPGGWAPVLVSWSDSARVAELSGTVAGLGGSARVPAARGGRSFLAAGSITLDSQEISRILGEPDGWARARAIVEHEFGHVVGLDHVDDQSELMAPSMGLMTTFGQGDRAGLARLGAIACDGQ